MAQAVSGLSREVVNPGLRICKLMPNSAGKPARCVISRCLDIYHDTLRYNALRRLTNMEVSDKYGRRSCHKSDIALPERAKLRIAVVALVSALGFASCEHSCDDGDMQLVTHGQCDILH